MSPKQRHGDSLRCQEVRRGAPWWEASTPALLVDLDKLESNIRAMAERARTAGVALRPHFKTHKSLRIARLQLSEGASGLAVSTLDELEVASRLGTQVHVTRPIFPPKLERAMAISADRDVLWSVDSVDGARCLSKAATRHRQPAKVLIEVDCGLGRTGVRIEDLRDLARTLAAQPNLALRGVFTHAGHVYGSSERNVAAIGREELQTATGAWHAVKDLTIGPPIVSVGSTPTVMSRLEFPGVTEIRPGNYVFFDRIQTSLGTIGIEDCALSVSATVISRPRADRAILDVGSKGIGLDKGAHGNQALSCFGVFKGDQGTITQLSEDHAIVSITADSPMRPGDIVRFIPNHACSTANLHSTYYGVRNGQIECTFSVDSAGGIH